MFALSYTETLITAVAGIAMALFVIFWTLAVKTDAYMLVSASGSASFIVPLILLLIFSGMMLLSLSGALELTNMINKLFFRKVGKDDKFQ